MRQFYFNHDGNIDDFVSYLLLLKAKDIKLLGVGAIDADGYVDPAVSACRKMTDLFNVRGDKLAVARSNSRAVHQFPAEWRIAAYSFNNLPLLNEKGHTDTKMAPRPAHLDMVEKLRRAQGKVNLVMTGPLTDLARALSVAPEIENKIEKLYWMGGSLNGQGNVARIDADGSQEWNSFWDPFSVKIVFDSNIPIQMVGLESTQEIPLNDDLRQHWASLRRYPAMDLVGQGYCLVNSLPGNPLYLWDVLTTMSALDPDLVETRQAKARVVTSGLSAGAFVEDEHGRNVDLVTGAHKDDFFKEMDELLERQA